MLDKVKIGAIVSAAVAVLGFFGITIPEDLEANIVALISAAIAIITYFTTAYVVRERKANVKGLLFKESP